MVLLSLDAQRFIMMIKQAAVEAVNAGEPMALKIGEVVSTAPLKISLNQKITIPASQLLLTNAVRDYTVYETVDHTTGTALGGVSLTHKHAYSGTTSGDDTCSGTTENAGGVNLGHSHSYTGRKKFTVHLGLKTGEKVLLLRCDGGQKFIVLDRLEAPNG